MPICEVCEVKKPLSAKFIDLKIRSAKSRVLQIYAKVLTKAKVN